MREMRTYGFVRGVPGDWHPYRDNAENANIQELYRQYRKATPSGAAR